MVKNEAIILRKILPIWEQYPIETFVFLNDGSEDDTVGVIQEKLGSRAVVLDRPFDKFHEAHNRAKMLDYSREKSDFVICIDADELLTSNVIRHWDEIFNLCNDIDLQMYWFNSVFDLSKFRQDPAYVSNFRTFILNTKKCGNFNLSGERYHTPRTPSTNLPARATQDIGVLHLQALNVNPGEINRRYDHVVNNLQFNEASIPPHMIEGISFDPSIFDEISEQKGYRDYITRNLNRDLVTFGKDLFEF